MSSSEEAYAILKQDMLCVYNTQVCEVIYEEWHPYKDYPFSYSYKKRNRLESKLYRNKGLPYAILRFAIKLILFPSILAAVLWLSYLVQDVIIGAMLGVLHAQLCTLLNMIINDSIKSNFKYERFSKFNKGKHNGR